MRCFWLFVYCILKPESIGRFSTKKMTRNKELNSDRINFIQPFRISYLVSVLCDYCGTESVKEDEFVTLDIDVKVYIAYIAFCWDMSSRRSNFPLFRSDNLERWLTSKVGQIWLKTSVFFLSMRSYSALNSPCAKQTIWSWISNTCGNLLVHIS